MRKEPRLTLSLKNKQELCKHRKNRSEFIVTPNNYIERKMVQDTVVGF